VLTLSPAVRIYVATGATDLRRSIDGLAALVRQRFDLDPLFCGGRRSVARRTSRPNRLP
jgi:transposase